METPTVLVYGQPIRAARWMTTATVFSVEGSVRENNNLYAHLPDHPFHNKSVAAAVHRAEALRHALAGSIYTGSVILANGPAKERLHANSALAMEHAEVLEPGQLVEIEGRYYRAQFPQRGNAYSYPRLSDPVHFVPVSEEETETLRERAAERRSYAADMLDAMEA